MWFETTFSSSWFNYVSNQGVRDVNEVKSLFKNLSLLHVRNILQLLPWLADLQFKNRRYLRRFEL